MVGDAGAGSDLADRLEGEETGVEGGVARMNADHAVRPAHGDAEVADVAHQLEQGVDGSAELVAAVGEEAHLHQRSPIGAEGVELVAEDRVEGEARALGLVHVGREGADDPVVDDSTDDDGAGLEGVWDGVEAGGMGRDELMGDVGFVDQPPGVDNVVEGAGGSVGQARVVGVGGLVRVNGVRGRVGAQWRCGHHRPPWRRGRNVVHR